MKMKIGNGRETAVFQYLCELAMKKTLKKLNVWMKTLSKIKLIKFQMGIKFKFIPILQFT